MAVEHDPLSDCLALLIRSGLDRDLCTRLIGEIRKRWGGAAVYIRATDRIARDESIRAGIEAGDRQKEIARRVEVSTATVRRRCSKWL